MAFVLDQANVGEIADDTSAANISLTTINAVAVNGFVVLYITWYASQNEMLSSVVGGGLTWRVDGIRNAGVNGQAIVSAQAPNGLAAGSVITATFTNTTVARSISASSFTGAVLYAANVFNANEAAQLALTNWTTNPLTVVAGDLIIVGAFTASGNIKSTPTAPLVELHDIDAGAASFDSAMMYEVAGSSGSVSGTGTWASTASGATLAIAYAAAPRLLQSRALTDLSAAAQTTLAYTNQTVRGSQFVAAVIWNGPALPCYVTDPINGQWAPIGSPIGNSGALAGFVAQAFAMPDNRNNTAASVTVSATISGSVSQRILAIHEFVGVGAVESHAEQFISGDTTPTQPSLTPVYASDIAFAWIMCGGSESAIDSGFTVRERANFGNNGTADLEPSGVSALAPTWTCSSTDNALGMMILTPNIVVEPDPVSVKTHSEWQRPRFGPF